MATTPDITVTVTRSAGDDRAVLVLIDTAFEPTGSDGGPGLRVLINDDEAYVGTAYDLGANHEAGATTLVVSLDDIPYAVDETTDDTKQHYDVRGSTRIVERLVRGELFAEPEPQVWCAEHGKSCPYGCIR
jgi:hypothetical protein